MKKLTVVLLAALGAVACTSSEEEAAMKAFWNFSPTDGCLADEEVWISLSPDPFGEPDKFNCENPEVSGRQEGTVGAIPLGHYDATAIVYASGAPVQGLAPVTVDLDLDVDGQIQERTFTFVRGFADYDVQFMVDFGITGGSNCAGTGKGGTGVVQQGIDIIDNSTSQCIALSISDDDTTADVEDSCSATNSVCFENTVTQTVMALPPGDYLFNIYGYKANDMTVPCWEASFAVNTSTFTAQAVTLGSLNVPYYTGANRPECEIVRENPIPEPPPELARTEDVPRL